MPRRLVNLSAESNAPVVSQEKPRPGAGMDAFSAGVLADLDNTRAISLTTIRRWPKFLWPSLAVAVLLAGLATGWAMGVFQSKPNATLASVENELATTKRHGRP